MMNSGLNNPKAFSIAGDDMDTPTVTLKYTSSDFIQQGPQSHRNGYEIHQEDGHSQKTAYP